MKKYVSFTIKCLFLILFNNIGINGWKNPFLHFSASSKSFVYRSYQGTINCNPSNTMLFPKDAKELQAIVKQAIQNNQTVKAIGNRHSITDVICTDGVPISIASINYAVDNQDGTATFGAGLELQDVMIFLEQRNLTLIGIPAYGGITIGGAIGTGAHGSSLLHSTSISDQIVNLTIIDGTGTVKQVSNTDADFNSLRVNLGLLGIIIDVTVQTVPLFKMTIESSLEQEAILFSGDAVNWAQQYDFFQMNWFPSESDVVVAKGVYLSDITTPGNASSNFIPNEDPLVVASGSTALETLQLLRNKPGLYALETITRLSLISIVVGKPPIYTEDGVTTANPATGMAWRLMSSKCTQCAWLNGENSIFPEESSVAFELKELPSVINSIRNILKQLPASFSLIGVLIRFSKPSDALMAISSGRQTFTVEWTTPMRKDPFDSPRDGIGAYQQILQTMVKEHNGRPHWGKNGLHYFTQTVFQTSIPNRNAFIDSMKKYDPNGIFLNKFGKRILGTSDQVDMDPQVSRCALQDYCICIKATDCALFQYCATFENGYSVCKDLIEVDLPPFPSFVVTNLISFFNTVNNLLVG